MGVFTCQSVLLACGSPLKHVYMRHLLHCLCTTLTDQTAGGLTDRPSKTETR